MSQRRLNTARVQSSNFPLQQLKENRVQGIFDTPAIVDTLQDAVDGIFVPCEQRAAFNHAVAEAFAIQKENNFQRLLRRAILKEVNCFSLQIFLSARFVRIKDQWPELPLPEDLAARACHIARTEFRSMPPRVISAVLKAWCNGWCTSRRFQNKDGELGCVFGCHGKPHSLEHYASCFQCCNVWVKMTTIQHFNGPIGFLCLVDQHRAIVALRCLHLYAVYSVVMRQNALKKRMQPNSVQIMRCIKEKWNDILSVSRECRRDLQFVRHHSNELCDEVPSHLL